MKTNATRTTITAVLAVVGLACSAQAQDSFSNNSGVNGAVGGDALRPHTTTEQGNAYVVDLTSLVSSWNTEWGIGILSKSSKVGAAPDDFFNTLMSNTALSVNMLSAVDRSGTLYRLWESADFNAGVAPGVNATANTSEYIDIAGPASSLQLGWGFAEFGGNENSDAIGGTVAWTASNPGRLYVNRIVALVNNSADDVAGSADPSLGSVDANANMYFRSDRANVTGNQFPTTGTNLFRVRAESRNLTKINWLNSQLLSGTPTATNDTAATDTLVTGYGFNYLPPANLQQGLGRRLITTSAFDTVDYYVYENPVNSATSTANAHVDTTREDGLRGTMRVVPLSWFNGAVATGAQLVKPKNGANYNGSIVANTGGETWGVSVWGIDGNGGVVAGTQRTYALPHAFSVPGAPITDNAPGGSGINPATGLAYVVPNTAEFDNYRGTAAFRGPASQVAVGADLSGNKYIAAVVYNPPQVGLRYAEGNALVVGKLNTTTAPGTVTWSVAAWNNFDGSLAGVSGKPILDGPNGNVIGRMVAYEIVDTLNLRGGFSNGSIGPSISCPAMDSAGNIYFVTSIQLQRGNTFDDYFAPQLPLVDDGNGNIDMPNAERDLYELGLVRAVLDPSTFTYQLELVARTGQVYTGGNTGADFLLDEFTIANNSNGGPSPQAFASGDMTLAGRNNTVAGSNASADALGGLVVSAKIVYDLDGLDTVHETNSFDGSGYATDYPVSLGGSGPFEDLSIGLTPLFPASEDQAYRALLFIGNQPSVVPTGACCVDVTICVELSQYDCELSGGVYQGDGTNCTNNPCQPADPTGACCFTCNGVCPTPGGSNAGCVELTAAQCAAVSGLYVGNNSTCTQGIGGPCDCPGDVNGDGNTNSGDFNILAGSFGGPFCKTHQQGDLNCDGIVNSADFNILAGNFGCTRN